MSKHFNHPVYRFEWIIEKRLAVSAQPMSKSEYEYLVNTDEIDWIINLREFPIKVYFSKFPLWGEGLNLQYFHVGTDDGTGFLIEQFEKISSIYVQASAQEKKLLIHCAGGQGRTSTAVTSLWMKAQHVNVNEAFLELSKKRRFLACTKIQELSLKDWEQHLNETEYS